MKVIILAGGFGTRLSEYTDHVPKPMVHVGNRPILWHIMNRYAAYGFNDFYLALGYKADRIKEYFLHYHTLNSDFTVNLKGGGVELHHVGEVDWKVTLVQTGEGTMTGGRVKRMQPYIGNERFLLTYGDGVADINIKSLVEFHESHNKMVSVTAVRPPARFGELGISHSEVTRFKEKPQTNKGWINGGFFLMEPAFFDLIDGDDTVLEAAPLERASEINELMAYKHRGYWQCMDTKRDRESLEELWESGRAPWIRFD